METGMLRVLDSSPLQKVLISFILNLPLEIISSPQATWFMI
jgi:hypothetical protein